MTLPHEIEVGEIVGLRHWKLITKEKFALPPLESIEACVAYAKTPHELAKITRTTACDYKIVRDTRLSSGLIGDGIIWPADGCVEAKCIRESPAAIEFKVGVKYSASQLEDAWCARRGHGPAPCTMDRPFVCNNGYSGSQCGIYAWNTQGVKTRDIEKQINETVSISTPYVVWGLVALSGRVVEHEEGYRAEFARPIALLVPPHLCWKVEQSFKSASSLIDLYKVEKYADRNALLLGLHLYEKEKRK